MRRVMLHLGLHKTGTTAAQSFLFENRALIWPNHALVLPYKTRGTGLSEAATRYSVYGTHTALMDFSNQMRNFLGALDFGAKRGLVLSEENFAGLRPSRNPAIGYEATPDLAVALVGLIRNRFAGQRVDINLYLSLRQRDTWLRSLWSHDLQRTRLVQDFDTYAARLDAVPSLDEVAAEVQKQLPRVSIHTEWLEDLQTMPFGPGTPFAEFLDLDAETAAQLVRPTKSNPGLPADVLQEILLLNRSDLDEAALDRRKNDLVESTRKNLVRAP